MYPRRYTNAAGHRQGFERGLKVHTITKDVAVLNDNVALVDANANSIL